MVFLEFEAFLFSICLFSADFIMLGVLTLSGSCCFSTISRGSSNATVFCVSLVFVVDGSALASLSAYKEEKEEVTVGCVEFGNCEQEEEEEILLLILFSPVFSDMLFSFIFSKEAEKICSCSWVFGCILFFSACSFSGFCCWCAATEAVTLVLLVLCAIAVVVVVALDVMFSDFAQ